MTIAKIDQHKFANTVLYLLRGCPDRPGLTKLLKLLYFSDFSHYRKNLCSITGASYVALERGPVPADYDNHLQKLVDGAVIMRQDVEIFDLPKPKAEYSSNLEPNLKLFSDSEIETLEAVLAEHGRNSGRELSARSHLDGPWTFVFDDAALGKPIPYAASRWLDNMCDEDDMEQAMAALRRPHVRESVLMVQPDFEF